MNPDEIRHFLIVYDVQAGRAQVREFDDYEAALSAYERLEQEQMGRDDLDVVLLGADSLETIKKTHSSYFETTEGGFEQFFSDMLAPR